ncbi:hypothetical protein [Serratia symbiotica]|uniref:hypothetical protein n=1 Tax=Serratia symbiotica TaxID=138074 RepID=UPI003464AD9C
MIVQKTIFPPSGGKSKKQPIRGDVTSAPTESLYLVPAVSLPVLPANRSPQERMKAVIAAIRHGAQQGLKINKLIRELSNNANMRQQDCSNNNLAAGRNKIKKRANRFEN